MEIREAPGARWGLLPARVCVLAGVANERPKGDRDISCVVWSIDARGLGHCEVSDYFTLGKIYPRRLT